MQAHVCCNDYFLCVHTDKSFCSAAGFVRREILLTGVEFFSEMSEMSSDGSENVSVDLKDRVSILTRLFRHTARHLGVMFWSAHSFDDRTPLVVVRGILTVGWYVDDILHLVVLTWGLHFSKIMLGPTLQSLLRIVSKFSAAIIQLNQMVIVATTH